MPHSVFWENQFGVNQVIKTSGTSAANIRNIIDQGGQFTAHILPPAIAPIVAESDPLMIPGGITSTLPVADLIRDAISKFLGSGDGSPEVVSGPPAAIPQNAPIGGGLMIPDLTSMVTGGCGPRPKVQYIALPDGTVGCPSGYHPEKSGRGYCVRNRRMNPLNPRALARAGRRVGGFARAVKRARSLKRVCASL